MIEKLIAKKEEIKSDIIFYEQTLEKLKGKLEVLDELLDEIQNEEQPATQFNPNINDV